MRRAFTLIEIIVVIAVVSIFTSVVLPNFLTPVSHSSFSATLAGLVSDIRRQQLKSLQGEASAPTGPDYFGLRFASDGYTLFPGQVYSSSDPANTVIELAPSLRFSFINLPSAELIFAPGSGEAANFIPPVTGGDLTLYDLQTGQSAVIVINQYGVVAEIN